MQTTDGNSPSPRAILSKLAPSESTVLRYSELDPDVRLMLAVRDDDAAAFEELVKRYQARVVGILDHMIGDREAAEDLAQDVFLRIFRARKRYQPGSRFATWLFTITHNVARNARRSLSRRREVQITGDGNGSHEMPTLETLAKEASGMMPTRLADQGEMSAVVRQAMFALNDRQRMAVLLCKFEQMSYVEIAEAMEMTPQAIKSLLSRARGKLRDILEPYLREGRLPSAPGKGPS